METVELDTFIYNTKNGIPVEFLPYIMLFRSVIEQAFRDLINKKIDRTTSDSDICDAKKFFKKNNKNLAFICDLAFVDKQSVLKKAMNLIQQKDRI